MREAETQVQNASKIGRLGELFLQKGLLTPEQIDQVAQLQKEKKLRFGDAALALGYLTQAQLDQALGEQFGYSTKSLMNGSADPSLKFFYFPFSKEAEEIRRLRSELLLKFSGQEKIKLAMVSAAKGDGKSYMAASLAIALSQVGKRTLLIDADLRGGSLHECFSLGKPDGLSSVLAGRISLADALIQLMPSLHLLPAGPQPPNPLEILRAPRIRELLESCSDQFDAFVIDTHAASKASDAQMVAHQTGSVLLLARADHTYIDELRQTKADMLAAGVEVLGTIYNQHEDDGASRLAPFSWMYRLVSRMFRRKQ
ncbi:polysaccharide biosynthesis tyrosine autokinase [Undibacterium sp. Ji50W]|uniref:polysaccharide biosynthesis tyrosine autokinase n=1 Tax=Undibacterium sp. Ji50W TaxID=3413041 RepID=UPI003BF340C2